MGVSQEEEGDFLGEGPSPWPHLALLAFLKSGVLSSLFLCFISSSNYTSLLLERSC